MTHQTDLTGVSRRGLLKGAASLPLAAAAALPLASVLASPALAQMAAATATEVFIQTQEWDLPVRASLSLPEVTPAPAVVLIHEWWGLNDQIKAVGAELAKQGYVALSIDLYGGQVATDVEMATRLVGEVSEDAGIDTLKSWVNWLRGNAVCNGKVAAMGWCYGGGWSLETAIEAPVDASIIHYGRVTAPIERLSKISGPVLGHFATKDQFINGPMVDGFKANMKAAGKALTVHMYEADHGFANPTSARYDDEDAALAWQRTVEFLAANLGDS